METNKLLQVMDDKSLVFHDKVDMLLREMRKVGEDLPTRPVELPAVHHFLKGMYVRELFIPAGSLIVGKIHKQEHIIQLMTGVLSILTEDDCILAKAPYFQISPAGTRRIVYAHTDVVGMNIHHCETDNLEEAEAFTACETLEEYQEHLKKLENGGL